MNHWMPFCGDNGQSEQFVFIVALGADGVRAFADEVAPVVAGFAEAEPGLVRVDRSTRSPQNQDVTSLKIKWLHHPMVVGLQGRVTEIENFLLDRVYLTRGKAGRRHDGVAALFVRPLQRRSDFPIPPVPLILNGWVGFCPDAEKEARWACTEASQMGLT
jgi:hypothetical protein